MDALSEFPTDFFKAVEIGSSRLALTIKDVTKETMNDGRIKPVLHFREDGRGLVLNVENRLTLVERYGRDTVAWAGKQVVLITRRVQGPSGPCAGIRFADQPVGEAIGDALPMGDVGEATPAKRKRAFK